MAERDLEKRSMMAGERTPLIQTVPVAEERDRYPHARVGLKAPKDALNLG